MHAYAPYGKAVHGPDFEHFLAANPEAPKGCTLRLSARGAFDTLNPWTVEGRFASGVFDWLYDSLLVASPDSDQTAYGLIAGSLHVSDDGRTVTFRIRPDARFHDGTPIRASDVIFTADLFREHARYAWRMMLKNTVVTAEDDLTVRVHFPQGRDKLSVIGFGTMPVLPEHYWRNRDFSASSLEIPLGSGPYRITEVIPGRRIVFERVRDHWAQDLPVRVGMHNFNRVIYDHFFDDTARLTALMKGDVDRQQITEQQWIESTGKPAVRQGKVQLLTVPAWWPMGMNGFFFNLKDDRFSDRRVREALGMVVPFNWVNERLLHNAFTRTQSYFENAPFAATRPPTAEERAEMAAFRDQFPEAAFETAYEPHDANLPEGGRTQLLKAMNLLEEAGWTVDSKTGYLTRVHDGRPMDFTVLAFSESQEKLLGAWARQLEKLGVRARLQVVDSAAYEARMADQDFDLAYRFYIPSSRPGEDQIRQWGSAELNPARGGNRFGIDDPAIDHFLTLLQEAETEAERTFALRLLDRALQWGHYAVPSYQDKGFRYAYWTEKLSPPASLPAVGRGLEFWWCRQVDDTQGL